MPWRSTDEMTRDELIAQLEQLREIVERLAAEVPADVEHDADEWELLAGNQEQLRRLLEQRLAGEFETNANGERSTREMIQRKRAAPSLSLTSWRPGARKIPATQAIQTHCGLELADAKAAIDRCLNGETVELRCRTTDALVRELDSFGFDAALDGFPEAFRRARDRVPLDVVLDERHQTPLDQWKEVADVRDVTAHARARLDAFDDRGNRDRDG